VEVALDTAPRFILSRDDAAGRRAGLAHQRLVAGFDDGDARRERDERAREQSCPRGTFGDQPRHQHEHAQSHGCDEPAQLSRLFTRSPRRTREDTGQPDELDLEVDGTKV